LPRRRIRPRLFLVALLSIASVPAQAADPTEVASAIRTIVEAGQLEGLRWPRFPDYQYILRDLYGAREYQPLWLEGERPSEQAREAIAVLQQADTKGLDARDYDVETLGHQLQQLAKRGEDSPAALARVDVGLSVAVLRQISDLHIGKVNPKNLDFGYDIDPKKYDLAALVGEAVAQERIRDVVKQAEPAFTQNQLLKEQIAQYRQLAADTSVGPVALKPKIAPGDPLEAAPQLARWLAALGDLPSGTLVPTATYDAALVDAVKRFQARHGLEPDGVIGPATARALAVPAATRLRQIEYALERLRWIPALESGRVVFVNVPGFELLAFDGIEPGSASSVRMAVVVGRALKTETPIFTGVMRTVVFAPYWNVPRSIAKNEILPKLRSNPGYLDAQQMDIVSGDVVLGSSSAAIAQLAAGNARLRQRPGKKNALGRVKFLFPNHNNVYLHDTPSQAAFQSARRDFSHGCIRLASPGALARWVLEPEGWDAARVESALAAKAEMRVTLQQPIPVVISYSTAVARPDGTIAFYEDIYRHDAALERALAKGYPYLP
jgi:L,D-transpeptidase YcbB